MRKLVISLKIILIAYIQSIRGLDIIDQKNKKNFNFR